MIYMTQGWCFAGPPRSGFGRWQPSEALYLRCVNIIATGVGAVKVLLDHKDADCGQFRLACAQACPFHGLRLTGQGLQSRRWARALPATAIAREQAVFPPKPLGAGRRLPPIRGSSIPLCRCPRRPGVARRLRVNPSLEPCPLGLHGTCTSSCPHRHCPLQNRTPVSDAPGRASVAVSILR